MISKKLEIIYHNGQPDGIRSIRRHLSTMTTYVIPPLCVFIHSCYVVIVKAEIINAALRQLDTFFQIAPISKAVFRLSKTILCHSHFLQV